MKVLALVPEAFGGHGGIAKYLRDFLGAVCAHPRVELVHVLPRVAPQEVGPLPPGLRHDPSGLHGKRPYLQAVARALLRRERVDLVVCGHVNLLPVAHVAALRHRAPLVLLLYGIDAWAPPPSRLAAALVPRTRHFVSISETTLERFLGWAKVPRERCHVLLNAFEPSAFGQGPKPAALLTRYHLHGRRVLMTFGRMEACERYKGFDEVLELLPLLRAESPEEDFAYLAVGDGNDRVRLEQKAQALGLAEHVVFAGRISEAEKADHFRLADVYVMPSHGEGFGFVFLEAMACGIPVIASRTDGSREAVRDGLLGQLVDPARQDELKAAVREALRRPREVPAGLDYFSYENFERRAHALLDVLVPG